MLIDKDQSPAKGGEVVLSLFYCGNHKFMQTYKQAKKETVFSQRRMTAVFSFQGRWRFSAVNLQLTQIKREISCDVISLPVETSQDGFNSASSCARVSPEPLFSGLRWPNTGKPKTTLVVETTNTFSPDTLKTTGSVPVMTGQALPGAFSKRRWI